MLESRGLTIFRNERIGRWCPDGIIPAHMAVVEYDGDYWHSLPGIAEKDARKARELRALGWRVVRVPEGDFNRDPIGTVERVRLEVMGA